MYTYVNFDQNPALAAWLWLVMKHEEQKSRLQKHLKRKQLGVRVNEDAIYIQQVENDRERTLLPSPAYSQAFQAFRLDLHHTIPWRTFLYLAPE